MTPEQILNRAMTLFMTEMAGTYDAQAPLGTQWAQAMSAFLQPDTDLLRRGQIEALETWIGQAAGDEDQRHRLIALTILWRNFPGMEPASAAAVRDDPARLISLADFWLSTATGGDDGDGD